MTRRLWTMAEAAVGVGAAFAVITASPALAATTAPVPVSGATSFGPGCNGATQPGTLFPRAEVEPFVATNPTNPSNLVAVWQQDRWSNGGSQALLAAYS